MERRMRKERKGPRACTNTVISAWLNCSSKGNSTQLQSKCSLKTDQFQVLRRNTNVTYPKYMHFIVFVIIYPHSENSTMPKCLI